MSAGMQSDRYTLFFGVDGGGSRTRVRVADALGHTIAVAEGGSANVYLAYETALATIGDTLARAADIAGLDASQMRGAALGLGLAGISSDAVGERIARHFADRFGRVVARNDAVIACLGAHAGQDGGLVIAGTGSAAVLRLNGRDVTFGGRGFLLGDDGSGAVMGRQIWRRALRAHDGLEAMTPLLQELMAEFGHDPVAVIAWGRHATSGQFGAYAPRIFAAAQANDKIAADIVAEASRAIAELVEALLARGAPRVSLVGGLAQPLLPTLPETVRARLHPPLQDALTGALLLAGAPALAPPDHGASTAGTTGAATRDRVDTLKAQP